jgi:demethylmenaquinone methyltransferase/2-methoxy-6-polyprenyl-1,4-benzoquinol methylase
LHQAGTGVLPPAEEKADVVEAMFDRVAPRYDMLNRMLTFRMDVRWRDIAVHELQLDAGSVVLDLACGTGDLCRVLSAAGMRAIGVDFSAGMLGHARTDVSLVRADVLRLPLPDASVDGATCGFALRNFTALPPFFAECARVVRRGGRIALLEVSEPVSAPARAVHHVWFRRVVPFVGGLLSDRAAYAYLPASTAYLPPVVELIAAIGAAGFERISTRTLGFGAARLVTATRA